MKLIFHTIAFTGLLLLSASCHQVTGFPTVQHKNSDLNPLNQLITRLEKYTPILRDDNEDTTRRDLIFPGVLNVIFGVVTGDLRRVLEDGAFSFVNKGARDRVFLFYNNLLGKTTMASTKPSRRRKTTTPDFDSDGDETDAPEVTTLSSQKSIPNYWKASSTSGQGQGEGSSKRKISSTATKPKPADEEEDDDLVERFEKVLLAQLPLDPNDDDGLSAIVKDNSVII